jgi:uncharacterized damage-inducible protein DinB
MEPVRIYDYLALSRRRIFDWTRPLTPEQYTREHPIGLATLARTLTHLYTSEWYYLERMQERDVPAYDTWPIRDETPPPFAEIEAAWTEQAARTRVALAEQRDWTAPIQYRVTNDAGSVDLVTTTAADIATQLALHEMHHRAQAMNMLRHLGVNAEDIDFNTLMYDRRPAPV